MPIINQKTLDAFGNVVMNIIYSGPNNVGGELNISLPPEAMEILVREFAQDFKMKRKLVEESIAEAAINLSKYTEELSIMAFMDELAIECAARSVDINKVDA